MYETTAPHALTPADEPVPQQRAPAEVDAAAFRAVLGHFPTGVTVVTACSEYGPVGLSIASFTSVSLDPPLVGFLPARVSRSWPLIRSTGRFCVNILAAGQREIAERFAAPHDDRFGSVTWTRSPYSGSPLLDGVAAWVDCEIEAVAAAGDHHFVLGRVHALGAAKAAGALIFHRSAYKNLSG